MSPVFGAWDIARARRAAADAVVWGLPLILSDLVARAHPLNGRFYELPAGGGSVAPGLVATHRDLWSGSAMLDISAGPAAIALPNSHGAYLTLTLHDNWGRILASIGPRERRRAIAVVGRGWTESIKPEVIEVRAPGDRVWAVCHVLSAGEGGSADAVALRSGVAVRSNDGYSTADKAEILEAGSPRSFADVLEMMAPATFFWRLARLTSAHPQHAADVAMMKTLRLIGVSPGQPFSYRDWAAPCVRALEDGFEEGLRRVRWAATPDAGLGDGAWAPAAAGLRHRAEPLERAAAALSGLGAAPADEVMVFTTRMDAAGLPLTGERDYSLAFEADALPPAGAFWSVCLIDHRGAPLETPFARLSVGDWFGSTPTPGERLEIAIRLGGEVPAGRLLRPPPGPFGLRIELHRPDRTPAGRAWAPPKVVSKGACSARANVTFAAARFAAAALPPRAAIGPAAVHVLH